MAVGEGFRGASTLAYYNVQKSTSRLAAERMRTLWQARVKPGNVGGTWPAIREQVVHDASVAQLRAASTPPYLTERLLAADGLRAEAVDEVPPEAFAGWTADGLTLADVLDTSPLATYEALLDGASEDSAWAQGMQRLMRIVDSEVQDAGRGSMDAAIRLEPNFVGYERYVSNNPCDRCLILAGRIYRKAEAFERHPRCSCYNLPATSRSGAAGQEPLDIFNAMGPAAQNAAFTKAGAQAIRQGADMNSVVNARYRGDARGKTAGMSRPGDPYTTVRARGVSGRRLSPQGVALKAGANEVLYRQLLKANGYLP